MNKPHKPYWEMNTAELREATKEYDKEFLGVPGKPLTPAQKARHERVLGRPGRPRMGRGAQRVLVTIERGLLERADAFARRQKITRAALIARALETVLAKAG